MIRIIKREILTELLTLAGSYPILTITGPRQSGKTTLAKEAFPTKPYTNLEELDIRSFAKEDPRRFLGQFPEGAILDEIQHVPELLSYIQSIVDQKNQHGMFVLTGSHQLALQRTVTQSLAGRVALLQLLPLSIDEVRSINSTLTVDDYLLQGFYPRVYKDNLNPTKNYANYVHTYLERDIKELINVKDLSTFRKFIKLCAGRIGQILNMASLSNDVGISSHTIKHWLSILEASYIIVLLQPYYENFGKRLIKSPKLYFNDVGLASYLLGIETVSQLSRDPLRGSLFENLVLLDLIKQRLNKGKEPRFYYYRDSGQHEIDIIYQSAHKLIPIEVKASETYHQDFAKTLRYFHELTKSRCDNSYVVYAGKHEQLVGKTHILNYQNLQEIIEN